VAYVNSRQQQDPWKRLRFVWDWAREKGRRLGFLNQPFDFASLNLGRPGMIAIYPWP
jgi:hypothetical protein